MKLIIAFIFLIQINFCLAQNSNDENLAIQFFQFKDYEKAQPLFQQLYITNPTKYFDYLFKCNIQLKKYAESIQLSKTSLKGKESKNLDLNFKLGFAYYKSKDSIQAKKQWKLTNDVASSMPEYNIQLLINQYSEIKQWNQIEDLILKFQSIKNNENKFQNQLVDIYFYQNKYQEAIDLILKEIDKSDIDFMSIIARYSNIQDNKDALKILEKKIYAKLNTNPSSQKWNELAIWISTLQKDFEQAMMIAKAMDKRLKNDGQMVFQVSELACKEEEYLIAIDGYDFIIQLENSTLSKNSFENKLNTYYLKIENSTHLDSFEFRKLKESFDLYFKKYKLDHQTASIQILYSDFLLKYLYNTDLSINILTNLINLPLVEKQYKSRAKINLADIKLFLNEIWESSLLYGQVDKDEKDSPLGEEARFKNSKIFYYNGDYELAEELLSILKSSTSELIANDALYLAQFIQDNKDGDTLEYAMKDISNADLLFYQNKTVEALNLLNSLKKVFPNSSLIDDALMLEASYDMKRNDYLLANEKYNIVITKFSNSILCDKAIYESAKLEESIFRNTSIAMEKYLLILTKYKDSVFATDARKRLRNLRGEKLEEDI